MASLYRRRRRSGLGVINDLRHLLARLWPLLWLWHLRGLLTPPLLSRHARSQGLPGKIFRQSFIPRQGRKVSASISHPLSLDFMASIRMWWAPDTKRSWLCCPHWLHLLPLSREFEVSEDGWNLTIISLSLSLSVSLSHTHILRERERERESETDRQRQREFTVRKLPLSFSSPLAEIKNKVSDIGSSRHGAVVNESD